MTKTAPASAKASSNSPGLLAYSCRCLFSPSRAAESALAPGSLRTALMIYAVFLLATAAFFAWKPFDFPDGAAPFPRESQDLAFWLKVMAWQPLLELVWIAFLIALLEWFKDGKLFFKMLGGVAGTAAPFVLLIAYRYAGLGRAGYAALAFAWLALMAYWARRADSALRAPAASLMVALNAIGLVMLAPMALSVAMDSETLFKGAQIVGGLWVLGCGTLGLRALTRAGGSQGLRLPRCFMAVLLSMFMQIAFAFTLHMLGLVPKDILKALLYA